VPSAVTPIENNIVLNPRHADMSQLSKDEPEPFAFDRRLRK
jgi:RES domain-containing protein